MEQTIAIQLKNITKRFGKVVANDSISLEIRRGEILSLLGENGSGKTTLMNMIAGIYFPDEGDIYVNDEPVTIRSPRDALDLGIGMIHQHFKLVDLFTATENIILGLDGKLDLNNARQKVQNICDRYGFDKVVAFGDNLNDLSLFEAAEIDGCSPMGIFFKIVLPLSKAALASIGLMFAVTVWNDYSTVKIYITNPDQVNFQYQLRNMIMDGDTPTTQYSVSQNTLYYAAIVCAILPFMALYPFLQKYFVKGVNIGAVKE